MGEHDLISRAAAINAVNAYDYRGMSLRDVRTVTDGCANEIRRLPAIDAVPVVRCKNCRHWGTDYGGETENIKVCEYANYMVGKNGYCVYAERNMEGENECSDG